MRRRFVFDLFFVQMLALSKSISEACSDDVDLEMQIAELSRYNTNLRQDLGHSLDERKKLRASLDDKELAFGRDDSQEQ